MTRVFNKAIKWNCTKCDGSMYEKDAFDAIVYSNGFNGRCVCYLPNKFLDANIGFDYWDISPENWQGNPTDLKNIIPYFEKVSILVQQGRGFFIYGKYGTGKTSLACMFLKHVIMSTNYSVLFVPFSELVLLNSKIMTGWHDTEIETAINQIKNIDFLVLDDLAKEYDNERDNGRATLNTILRYRDLWRKPTIYTANIPLTETTEKYGASNFSIMWGRSTIISMENDLDFRAERKMIQEANNRKG